MTAVDVKRNKTVDIAQIAMFAAILAICSWISIPTAIPFTLQTFGVFLAVGVLGGKKGTLAVVVYIILGMIGVPVFAGFSGGMQVLLGSTGGYIIGFILSALLMWTMEKIFGKNKAVLLISMILGLLVCYLFGTIWFMTVFAKTSGAIGIWTALTWCVIPYLIPDGIKIAVAFVLSLKLTKILKFD